VKTCSKEFQSQGLTAVMELQAGLPWNALFASPPLSYVPLCTHRNVSQTEFHRACCSRSARVEGLP
jgi:hypothetical protein